MDIKYQLVPPSNHIYINTESERLNIGTFQCKCKLPPSTVGHNSTERNNKPKYNTTIKTPPLPISIHTYLWRF